MKIKKSMKPSRFPTAFGFVRASVLIVNSELKQRHGRSPLLRYWNEPRFGSCPPGIILESELRDKTREMKDAYLLHLTPETVVDVLVHQVVFEEPLISDNRKPQLKDSESARTLTLTNCAFNKSGNKFITGSYDRTCKV
eukprot:6762-Heterococcus_DN1.PRE.1